MTSWLSESCTPGASSATISAARFSCAGLRNENRKQIAIDSTPAATKLARRAPHRVLVERHEHRAVGASDPFAHGLAVPPRHQLVLLPRQVELQAEVVRPLVARDVQDVAKAFGRDQPAPRAVVLEDDVGRDRGAVHEVVDVAGPDARLPAQLDEALDRPDRRIAHRGRHLVNRDSPELVVDEHEVDVRTADVDSDPLHAQNRCPRALTPPSTVSTVPETYAARGEAAKTTRSATSSGVAARPNGSGATSSVQRPASPVRSCRLLLHQQLEPLGQRRPRVHAEHPHAVVGLTEPSARVNAISPELVMRRDDDLRIGPLAAVADHVDDHAASGGPTCAGTARE